MTGNIDASAIKEFNLDLFRVNLKKGDEIDTKLIESLIQIHQKQVSKFIENEKYYQGKNTHILQNKKVLEAASPCNKIPVAKCRSMVNSVCGYMYTPGFIKYNSNNDKYIETINDYFYENDEQLRTAAVGKDTCIFGIGYELLYGMKNKDNIPMPYFYRISPKEIFPILNFEIDNGKGSNIVGAIRYYHEMTDIFNINPKMIIEVFTINKKTTYKRINQDYSIVSEEEHFFGDVPIVIYKNNDYCISDYEAVKGLIDANDQLMSGVIDENEKLMLSLLIIKGYKIDEDDIEDIKLKRIIDNVDKDGGAEFVTKNVNPEFLTFTKDFIKKSIEEVTGILDFTDETKFGSSNVSGIAMAYKMLPMEFVCAEKESNIKLGLVRRLELIDNWQNILLGDLGKVKEIEITFIRNIPKNIAEAVDVIQKGRGNIPLQILYKQYPDITNINEAIEMLDEENDPLSIDNTSNINFNTDKKDIEADIEAPIENIAPTSPQSETDNGEMVPKNEVVTKKKIVIKKAK